MLRFFVCVVSFLQERDLKRKNYECDGLGNSILFKMVFVLATWSKTVGEGTFSGQSAIFQGRGKIHCRVY